MAALYLIEILHQTTTSSRARARLLCCILLKFYIKPQQPVTRSRYSKLYLIEILHQTTTCGKCEDCLRRLYLIEILHQTTTCGKCEDCLRRLYLIEILHQTTTPALASMPLCRCILLKFYIKPQLRLERELAYCVVSYRNSTSNHNEGEPLNTQRKLYLIEILHQTTTLNFIGREFILLYLIEILHQTTTGLAAGLGSGALYLIEILHQTTTLNLANFFAALLYLIEILHQTTTTDSS